ncbi:MAG TPA: HAMP domain-containing sensor histidine kinase [Ktedonobacterales bacterium]|jgi:signal transduction histidine kinase
MAHSLIPPGASPANLAPSPAPLSLAQFIRRDPILLCACLLVGVLILYQVVVTLLHPLWLGAVTDWLRAGLAWPELAVMLVISWCLIKLRRPGARSWIMLTCAFISYTIARTYWTIDDRFLHPNHVPFPTLPDIFFLLQYPFFFLALLLLPGVPPWGRRVRVVLDCLLLMGAATALSWYFVLAPIYLTSGESVLGKIVNLGYPIGDLCLLFGLTVALIYRKCSLTRVVLSLLIAAVLCLVIADAWAAFVILFPQHFYSTGQPSDVFWLAFYLLVPLAGIIGVRLLRSEPPGATEPLPTEQAQPALPFQDLKEALRFLSLFAAAVLASAAIGLRAIINPVRPMSPLAPALVIFGLLILVLARQGITLVENARLRREQQNALAGQLAAEVREQRASEVNQQMEAFLGIVSHELKTPVSSVLLGLQLLQRRVQRLAHEAAGVPQGDPALGTSQEVLETTIHQIGRLNRLVNDLLDLSLIQHGRLEFKVQPENLVRLVEQAVEEHRRVVPERTIVWHPPDVEAVPVEADAHRIKQVVTNYLTNALKYSRETAPVEVGMQVEQQQARVWVRDYGPGIPLAEQAHLWDRFHRVKGIEVQSGSGVGLGLGLYISRTIIEQHHGQVGVESIAGQGSTFWFSLRWFC